jgi:hypothetical protein
MVLPLQLPVLPLLLPLQNQLPKNSFDFAQRMKLKIVLFSFMLFCLSPYGWAKEHFPFLGEIAADKVSVRAGQNVNFERVDILAEGTSVIVYEEQYGWYRIQLPVTAKSFVRIDYLTLENDTMGKITGNRVNVRATRSVTSSALGQLEKDTYVRLVNKMDDWFQIVPVAGMFGWVNKDFVRFKSDTLPTMESLGLTPITKPSILETDIGSPPQAVTDTSSSVTVSGTVEPVSPADMLNNASYQLKSEDGKIYYLQIHPAVIGHFSRDVVRVDGSLVTGVASLPYPVIAVKKFQLVL